MTESLIRIAEAAKRAHRCHETIRRWIRNGELAAAQLPGRKGRWLVSVESLDAILKPKQVKR